MAELELQFLQGIGNYQESPTPAFQGIFIRAPIVEKILPYVEGEQKGEEGREDTVLAPSCHTGSVEARKTPSKEVQVLGVLPGRIKKASSEASVTDAKAEAGDIVAVRQGNVFGTSFHPELSGDVRIHVWWLMQLMQDAGETLEKQQP